MEMTLFPYTSVQVTERWLRDTWIYAKASSVEISALGSAEIVGSKIRLSQPLHWLAQEGSMGHTELDMGAVADAITDMVQSGLDPTMIRVWYHTHPKMAVFMSMTDMATIEHLSHMMKPVVGVCANDKGQLCWHITENTKSVTWEQTIPYDAPTEEEISSAKIVLKKYVTEVPTFAGKFFPGFMGSYSLCSEKRGRVWCNLKHGHSGKCCFRGKNSWVEEL